MIQTQTVFVLGAGASCPFGFPTGESLRELVCTELEQSESNNCKRLHQVGFSEHTIREFSDALRLSGTQSIDAFLGNRQEFEKIGKLAMASTLLPMEVPDKLFRRDGEKPRIGFSDWYQVVWDRMWRGCSKPEELLHNRVRFLTFNYDRSLERFLQTVIVNMFGVDEMRAAAVVAQISIHHIYGSFGPLDTLPYGSSAVAPNLRYAIENLRVMPNDRPERDDAAAALLSDAERVVFLGFGYDEINCARLGVSKLMDDRGHSPPAIFGTCFRMTRAQRDVAIARIHPSLGESNFLNANCHDFFGHFPETLL